MPKEYRFSLLLVEGEGCCLGEIKGKGLAMTIAEIAEQQEGLVVIITSDIKHTFRLYHEIRQFTNRLVYIFTDWWETLPYENFSPHHDIISSRLSILYQLPTMQSGILIMKVSTLMQRVFPYSYLRDYTLLITKEKRLSINVLQQKLVDIGYYHKNQVMEYGEYSINANSLDLYPMGSIGLYRIVFCKNGINSLYFLDPYNQRTFNEVEEISLLSLLREFPTNKASIKLFLNHWKNRFEIGLSEKHIYQQISTGILPKKIKYWQPLFFSEPLLALFDYFPVGSLLIDTGDLESSAKNFEEEIRMRNIHCNIDEMRPLLTPEELLWLRADKLFSQLKKWLRIQLKMTSLSNKNTSINFAFRSLPNIEIQREQQTSLDNLYKFLKTFTGPIIFLIKKTSHREVLSRMLSRIRVKVKPIIHLNEATNNEYYLMIGDVKSGFIDTIKNRALICENDLFGTEILQDHKRNYNTVNCNTLISNLTELYIGQPIVHMDHGIGRYSGMTIIETGGIKREYLVLIYANDTKLYVPVSSLHLISRYTGSTEENAPLHKLGGDSWLREKKKVAKKVQDVAVELLDIYANRVAKKGFSYKLNTKKYQLFCNSFPFKITPDQEKAINAVCNDMQQSSAMDRLICGDVGFGKTEVAIRAAFIATENKKQVAVLVPTTILAKQLFDTFRDRIANWSVSVEMLSRFRSTKEQSEILEQISEGKIDIVIGTHKLLHPTIKWKNLGLLIIDEEHRFGVLHKERLKAMRTNIDILTLTATPIPRTLSMAMSGIRDLSIIATPPARRKSVKTFVRKYDDLLVREAILREILRGGQVYYLYNDIKNIQKIRDKLKELVPEARISVSHGQMKKQELEKVLHDFQHQHFDVLVCTTIIEAGIDIPTANTIIIERADHFGLAQLHQLRGRVGRSHHQAYAWFLIPQSQNITEHSKKRLEILSSLEDLGAGFAIATHDLEIRGAGEVLGKDQSGSIESIGFSLYMELLENAVKSLRLGKSLSLEDLNNQKTEIELHIPSLLPDNFIPNTEIRLSFYKRIAIAKSSIELEEIKIELIDRFGPLLDPVKNLLEIAEIRQEAQKLGIRKVESNEKGGKIEFSEKNHINMTLLLELLQNQSKHFRLETPSCLRFNQELKDSKIRIKWIRNFIRNLMKKEKSI